MAVNDPLAWYALAIAGRNPPITTTPECGYFLAKMNGKMIPVSIYYDGPTDEDGNLIGDEVLRCEMGGVMHDPEEAWMWCAKRVVTIEEYTYWLTQLFNEAST